MFIPNDISVVMRHRSIMLDLDFRRTSGKSRLDSTTQTFLVCCASGHSRCRLVVVVETRTRCGVDSRVIFVFRCSDAGEGQICGIEWKPVDATIFWNSPLPPVISGWFRRRGGGLQWGIHQHCARSPRVKLAVRFKFLDR